MTGKPAMSSPLQIGACWLKNRLVALPLFTGYAHPDGSVSPPLLAHYARLAATGVSMVVVANVAVSADAATSHYNLRIDQDDHIPGLKALADTIRQQGALACIQLNHAGRFARTAHPLLASAIDTSNLAYNLSALKDFINAFPLEQRFGLTGFFLKRLAAWQRAMTDAQRDAARAQFRSAAIRANEAGFDMIELHGANGYLLCEFLSPAANKLSSGFGGSFENRMAFPLSVIQDVKEVLPPERPLGFRLLLNEWVPGGISLPEALAFAGQLERAGIEYLSAAAGTFNSMFSQQVAAVMAAPAYLRDGMAALTRQAAIPTIISGRITTPALADALLRQGVADLIGLGRALQVDGDWVKKALGGGPRVRTCRNCNWCLKRVILEQGFSCRRWPITRQLKADLDHMMLTRNYNGLWVVSDKEDLSRFKACLPGLFPAAHCIEPCSAPTALFLRGPADGFQEEDKTGLMSWARRLGNANGHDLDALSVVDRQIKRGREATVCEEIENGRYGLVLIGRDHREPWRERLLYRLRHKIVGLISPHDRLAEVAVLLDFSASSLLIGVFLRHAYGPAQPAVRLRFFHALTGSPRQAQWRWEQLKRATGIDADAPIELIPANGHTTGALLKEIETAGCGTIIMGKRGLSGIKRLLLGSVSRKVMRRTHQQTLILVD